MPKPIPSSSTKAYARAGVDIDLGNRLKGGLGHALASTHGKEVLGKAGGFGGLFLADFKGLRQPVLVSSIDGVGTKLKLAVAMDRHDTIGQDLVNHCVNDIAVVGAKPLFFLDYIGAGKLEPRVFQQVLAGLVKACKAAGCALVGGETAQMPGIYQGADYDLAGCIVGVVEKGRILDGRRIRKGDAVLGLAADGLHTNGYSLARDIFFNQMGLTPQSKPPGLRKSLGDELLRIHPNYQPMLAALPAGTLKGAAHITGGGLIDNLPRILPENCDAVIDTASWQPGRLFEMLQEGGNVPREEMYQVFNMGIGMALVVAEKDAAAVMAACKARRIGRIENGSRRTRLE
jgi:phosphoribosylformylglycinamidine cyclo-ligase